MVYAILAVSLLVVFLMIFSKNIVDHHQEQINLRIKKRLDPMLKLIIIAPAIVLIIISILTLTYFKTKFGIRLSHAWFVLSCWICSIIFYYILATTAKIKKPILIAPVMGMGMSLWVAIYLTPLPHYETLFKRTNLLIPNVFGLVMLVIAYYINFKLLGIYQGKQPRA